MIRVVILILGQFQASYQACPGGTCPAALAPADVARFAALPMPAYAVPAASPTTLLAPPASEALPGAGCGRRPRMSFLRPRRFRGHR